MVAGFDEMTPVQFREDPATSGRLDLPAKATVLGPGQVQPGETFYVEIEPDKSGDGTVPIQSSYVQFKQDVERQKQGKIVLSNYEAGHLKLLYQPESQVGIMKNLGLLPVEGILSLERHYSFFEVGGSLANTPFNDAGGFLSAAISIDPVGALVLDQNGQPILGFDAATGQVIQSEGTLYLGGPFGLGTSLKISMAR